MRVVQYTRYDRFVSSGGTLVNIWPGRWKTIKIMFFGPLSMHVVTYYAGYNRILRFHVFWIIF